MFLLNTNWYKIFYWMTVADGVKEGSLVIGIITAIILGVYCVGYGIANSDGDTWVPGLWMKRTMYTLLIMCSIAWLARLFVPSKKDMLLIVVGGAVGNFITTDSSSRAIPADLTKYLHKALQKETEDLSDEARAELGMETPKQKLIRKAKTMGKDELIEWLKSDTTTLKE